MNEGKLRIHEGSCSLDRSELGKTEALRLACEENGKEATGVKGKRGIVNRIVQERCKWTGKCLLISLG